MTSTMKDKDREPQCHTDTESFIATNTGATMALEGDAGQTNGELTEAVDRFMFTDDDAQPSGRMEKDKARQRLNHNNIERKRKDRIKTGIQSIREILPPPKNFEQKESANAVLERAAETIQELRAQNDRLLVQGGDQLQAEEIEKLRNEIEVLKNENERYQELLMQAGIPHTIEPSSVCLSWTRKGKVCMKKATANSDTDAPTDDVTVSATKQLSSNLAGSQWNEIDNVHQISAQCQMGFDTMSNFAVNAGLFTAPGGTPASGMFAPVNVLAGMAPEIAARAVTSNANWLMLPSNVNPNAPTSNVVLGAQESMLLDDEHKAAESGATNACMNKVVSCDASVLSSSQTGAVTIGNSGDATTVTQSLNLKTPIMATNQGSTNIATAQQQHVITLNDPLANQNAGIPMLQNPALVAGAMPGQQLRGNILMHNGQLILINDQTVMPTMVKNEATDRPTLGLSTSVSGAGVAVQSPCSGRSSLQCTPASTPVPSNIMASVASTPLFTQSMTTSNTLLPPVDGVNANWTTPLLPNQLAQPAVLPPGMQPVKFVSNSTPQPSAAAAPLVANQCVTVNTPQGVVTMNTTPSQPNQLPSALVLPNGQIIPVVTQPNLLFPQQQCLPVNGGLLMAANNPTLVNHNHHLAVTTGVSGGVDVCSQMVAPQHGMAPTQPAVTTASVITPDVTPDVTPALPLGVALNPQLPFHPQLAAPHIGMPLIAGQQMATVRAPSMQQMPLGVPVQALVPGKLADQKSCVVSTTTTAVATSVATSASPAPVTNLPSTVSAIITPEGNIILTLPPSSAGGNTGNLTFDQNGFPLLSQPAGKVVPMATAAMGSKLKKPGQRVLMPKPSQQTVTPLGGRAINTPLGWNMSNNMRSAVTVATTNVTVSDSSVSEESSMTELLSVNVTTGGCVAAVTTTTTPSVTVTADLLAQATESIFSSALTDISPPISGTPSSYYNPANEDNPLHIDTSAADVAPPDDAAGTDTLMQPFTKPAVSVAKKTKSRPSKSSKKKSKTKDICATTEMMVSSNQAQTQSLDAASSHFLQQLASEKLDDDEESDINDFADLIRMPDRETGVAPTVSSSSVTEMTAVTSTPARVDKKNELQLNAGDLLQNNEKHLNEGSVTQAMKPLHEGPVRQTQKQLQESPVRQAQKSLHEGPVKQAQKPLHESPVRQVHPKCAVPATTQLTDKTQQDNSIFKLPEALTTPVTSDTKPKNKKKSSKSSHKDTPQASQGCTVLVLGGDKTPHLSEGAELLHLSMPYLSDMTDRGKTEPAVVTPVSNVSSSNTVDLTVDPSMQNHSDKQPMRYSSTPAVPCVASSPSANPTMKVSPKKDTSHESRRSRDTDHKKSKSKRSRSHQKSSKEQTACSLGDSLQPTNNNKIDVFDFDQDLMENSDKCLVLRPTAQDDGTKKSSPVGGDTSGRKRHKSSHSSKKQAQPPQQQIARAAPLKPEDIIPDTIMFDDSEMELSRVLEQVESYGETLQKVNSLSTSLSPPLVTNSLSPKKSRSRKSKTGDSADAPGTKKRKQDGTSESGSAADSIFTQQYAHSEAGSVGDKSNVADTQQTADNTSSDTVNTLLFGSADLKDTMTPEDAVSSKQSKTAVTHDMLSSAISPLPWTSTVGTTSASEIHCDYSTAMTTDSPTVPSDSSTRMAADLTDTAFSFSSPVASLSGLSPTSDAGNVATTVISSWAGSGEMMSPRAGVTEPMACHSHLVPLARQLAPPKLHSGALYTSQPRDVGSKVTTPSGRSSKAHKSLSVNASVVDADAKSQAVEPHTTATQLGENPLKKSHGDTPSKPMESVHLTNPFSSLDDSTVPSDDDRMAKMNEFSNKQQTNPECRQLPSSNASIAQASAASSVHMAQQEQQPYSAESLLSPPSENTSWSGLKDNASPSVHSHKSPASVISQTSSKPEQPKRSMQAHNTPVSFYSHSGFTENQADFSRASPKHSFALSVSCSQARQPQQEGFTFSPSFGVPASLAGNIRPPRDTHTMSPSSSSLLMTTTSPCSSSSTFSFSLSSTSNAPAMNTASYGSSLSRLQFYPSLHVPHGGDQTDMALNLHPYDAAANEHANAMAGRHSMCSSSHDKMVSPAGIQTSFPQFSGLVDSGRNQTGNKGSRSQQYSEPQRLTHPDKEPCMNSSTTLMSSSSVRMTTVSQMSGRGSSVLSVGRAGAVRRSPQMIYEPGPYFGPSGFPAAGPSPLTSPPLHHPGQLLSHQRSGTVSNSSANKQRSHYDFPGSTELPFGGLPFVPPPFDPALHLSGRHTPTNSQKDSYPLGTSLNPNTVNAGHKSGGTNAQGVGDTRKGAALLLPPTRSKLPAMPPSQPNRDAHTAVQQHQQPQKPSRSSKSSKKKQPPQQPLKQQQQLLHQQQHHDLDPYNAFFDPSRSLTPYFPIGSLSPPPRNLGNNEGPTYFGAGNFFCNSQCPPSLANSKPLQHKNTAGSAVPGTADLSFNALFPPSRHQNGLGINFQPPGFGMNHHAAMHSSAQIMPHANTMAMAPHMANFNLSNIFSDMNNPAPPPDSSLNISPIKFPHHGNTILPLQAGIDPSPLHHQAAAASSLYTNRSQMAPPGLHHSMSINSLLSHQHHGFDARGIGPAINSSVAPPFGGHAHSFGIPPLNFPMHDH